MDKICIMSITKLEKKILTNLIFNIDYMRKVYPFLKEEYFLNTNEKIIFQEISKFINKYNNIPTKSILSIEVENRNDITEQNFKDIISIVNELEYIDVNNDWLIDATEKWCKEKAVYIALMESIRIVDGKDKNRKEDSIPTILSNALSVSFNDNIGHDYIDDADDRYEFYHKKEEKIPFGLNLFDKITKGGLSNKTLNIALAGTGVGKSLFMCHYASSSILSGKNVLYITLEMSEERIAERIDANLLNIDIQKLSDIPKPIYTNRIQNISNKSIGKLIIKEYPTASAHVGHFKSLLNELELKKSFIPDIIFIDYLNICASSRYRENIVNSYTYVKAIAEELRGLAVEKNVPVFSATQTTRSGFSSSDIEITDTSESFGLPATADFMFALISSEQLESLNQILVKQLKNRYNDLTVNKKFVVGVDRSKMRLYDVEDNAQSNIVDSGQEYEEYNPKQKSKKSFEGFIV